MKSIGKLGDKIRSRDLLDNKRLWIHCYKKGLHLNLVASNKLKRNENISRSRAKKSSAAIENVHNNASFIQQRVL
jgi:hypothetical protein